MAKPFNYVPGLFGFLAGVAAVAFASRRGRVSGDTKGIEDLKCTIALLEAKMAEREATAAMRISQLESMLEAHATKLGEVPSTTQIVAAMEQLLSNTMSSLDGRLTNQAHALDVLKSTVSQTDGLLERVLESLDSLQSTVDPEAAEESLLRRTVA